MDAASALTQTRASAGARREGAPAPEAEVPESGDFARDMADLSAERTETPARARKSGPAGDAAPPPATAVSAPAAEGQAIPPDTLRKLAAQDGQPRSAETPIRPTGGDAGMSSPHAPPSAETNRLPSAQADATPQGDTTATAGQAEAAAQRTPATAAFPSASAASPPTGTAIISGAAAPTQAGSPGPAASAAAAPPSARTIPPTNRALPQGEDGSRPPADATLHPNSRPMPPGETRPAPATATASIRPVAGSPAVAHDGKRIEAQAHEARAHPAQTDRIVPPDKAPLRGVEGPLPLGDVAAPPRSGDATAPAPQFRTTVRTGRAEGGEAERTAISTGSPVAGPLASATSVQPAGAAMPSTEVARAVAPQLVSALSGQSGAGQIEIELDPPELGRVRIGLDIGDTGLRATLFADRFVTAELLRSHAHILMQQFQDAGFSDVDLRFGDRGGDGAPDRGQAQGGSGGHGGLGSEAGPAQTWTEPAEGIDLRF